MVDTDNALRVLARELYPHVGHVVVVDGQVDDLDNHWQPVDARLGPYGVTGADIVDETLFLRRERRRTVRERLWLAWMWLRLGLWWRWLRLQLVLWWERRGARGSHTSR